MDVTKILSARASAKAKARFVFRVTDTGIGIPPKNKTDLLRPSNKQTVPQAVNTEVLD